MSHPRRVKAPSSWLRVYYVSGAPLIYLIERNDKFIFKPQLTFLQKFISTPVSKSQRLFTVFQTTCVCVLHLIEARSEFINVIFPYATISLYNGTGDLVIVLSFYDILYCVFALFCIFPSLYCTYF